MLAVRSDVAVLGDTALHSDAAMNTAAAHNNAAMHIDAAVHDNAAVHVDAAVRCDAVVLSDAGSTMRGCSTSSSAQTMAEDGGAVGQLGAIWGAGTRSCGQQLLSPLGHVLSAAWAEQFCKGSCSSFAIYGLYSSAIGFRWCPVIKVACVGSQET